MRYPAPRMRDLTDRALDTATILGASYADARIVRRREESISIKSGRVEGVASGESEGFGVRVLVDGAWGFASSHVLTAEEADRVAGEAVRIARASATALREPVVLDDRPPAHGTYETPVQEDPFAVPLERKIADLLAADTAVVLEGAVLGKPADVAEAAIMLERLSGRTHRVLTAVAVRHAGGLETRLSESEVRFRATTAAERLAYCATGEPFDKAGGYGIQGHAAVFIEELKGSYSGVAGLPLFETAALLGRCGIDYWLTARACS